MKRQLDVSLTHTRTHAHTGFTGVSHFLSDNQLTLRVCVSAGDEKSGLQQTGGPSSPPGTLSSPWRRWRLQPL